MNGKNISAAAREYMGRVKSLPCGVCGAPGPSHAHHIKQGLHFATIPLCDDCHVGPRNGWHGGKAMWRVTKKDELIVLSETIEKLARGQA